MKFAMSVFNSFLLKPKILLTLPHFTPSLLKCLHSAQFIYGLRTYGRHFCALWQNIVTPTSGTECLVLRCNFFSRVPSRHTKSLGGMLPNDLVQQLKNNRGWRKNGIVWLTLYYLIPMLTSPPSCVTRSRLFPWDFTSPTHTGFIFASSDISQSPPLARSRFDEVMLNVLRCQLTY